MYWLDTSSVHEVTSSNVRYFKCDETSDIANLPTIDTPGEQQGNDNVSCMPCSKGSECTCIDPPSVWMLNSKGEWKQLG